MRHAFYTLITPELSPEEAIAAAVRHGFDGLEWRVSAPREPSPGVCNYWTGNRCSLDPADLDRRLPILVQAGRAAGLATVSLCAYHRPQELTALDRLFAIASAASVPLVRVSVPPYQRTRSYRDQWTELQRQTDQVEALARQHRVRACYLQHAGSLLPSASACYRLLGDRDPSHLGLYLDIGHFVREGYEDFGIVLDLLAPWLAEIHLRNGWMTPSGSQDAVGGCSATPRWGRLLDGHVPLGLLAESLGRHGWDGWLVLEDFSERPQEQRLAEGIATMRCLAAHAAGATVATSAQTTHSPPASAHLRPGEGRHP